MGKPSPETRGVIWPFDDEIKASGLLRVRDYKDMYMACLRQSLWQKQKPLLFAATLISTLYVTVPLTIGAKFGWQWWHLVVPVVAVLAVYRWIIHPYVMGRRQLRRLHANGKAPGAWAFSQVGIQHVGSETDLRLNWNLVTRAVVTKRYVVLRIGQGDFHVFTTYMFATPTDWYNFRTGIIRNFIGCRACGYDLYSMESDTCPECGKAIDLPSRTAQN